MYVCACIYGWKTRKAAAVAGDTPQGKAVPKAVSSLTGSAASQGHNTCPKGHPLYAYISPARGYCDGCQRGVKKGEHVFDCRYACEGARARACVCVACVF